MVGGGIGHEFEFIARIGHLQAAVGYVRHAAHVLRRIGIIERVHAFCARSFELPDLADVLLRSLGADGAQHLIGSAAVEVLHAVEGERVYRGCALARCSSGLRRCADDAVVAVHVERHGLHGLCLGDVRCSSCGYLCLGGVAVHVVALRGGGHRCLPVGEYSLFRRSGYYGKLRAAVADVARAAPHVKVGYIIVAVIADIGILGTFQLEIVVRAVLHEGEAARAAFGERQRVCAVIGGGGRGGNLLFAVFIVECEAVEPVARHAPQIAVGFQFCSCGSHLHARISFACIHPFGGTALYLPVHPNGVGGFGGFRNFERAVRLHCGRYAHRSAISHGGKVGGVGGGYFHVIGHRHADGCACRERLVLYAEQRAASII